MIGDRDLQLYEIPPDKLEKLETIPRGAILARSISFSALEQLAGKCTRMSVAVQRTGLYTHHMYKQISKFRRTGGTGTSTEISVAINGGLWSEMARGQGYIIRASWYEAAHHVLAPPRAKDTSWRGWRGLVPGPGVEDYRAVADVWTIGPGLTSMGKKPRPSGR